jgi:hypothetical protein
MLGTARTNPEKMRAATDQIKQKVDEFRRSVDDQYRLIFGHAG